MKFRTKPVVKEAVQLRWDTWTEMCGFADVGKLSEGKPEGCFLDENNKPLPEGSGRSHESKMGLLIPTLEGVMVAQENDWIIRGLHGELYACKPDIFEKTYERVEE